MDEPMKEFKYIIKIINNLDLSKIADKDVRSGAKELLIAVNKRIEIAIENYEKAHTEQNRPLSIDFGELAPEILKLQCGFGEDGK